MKRIIKTVRTYISTVIIHFKVKIQKSTLRANGFSIISNNCWGGIVYKKYEMMYLSPTVGCFFMSDDYIKFLKRLDYYLSLSLEQVPFSQSMFKDKLVYFIDREDKEYYLKQGDNTLIGKLDDIEVILFHYTTFSEAKEKWERRAKRVNYDKLLIKYNDQNGCTKDNVIDFEKLQYKYKIFFTSNRTFANICSNSVFIRKYAKQGYVVRDVNINTMHFNEKRLLNKFFR